MKIMLGRYNNLKKICDRIVNDDKYGMKLKQVWKLSCRSLTKRDLGPKSPITVIDTKVM